MMRNMLPKSDLPRLLVFGLAFMSMAYLLYGVIDAVVQGENVSTQLFSPGSKQFTERIASLSLLVFFIAYVSALLVKHRRLEEALVKYQAGMDASVDGIAILSKNYECVYSNHAYAKLHGYDSYRELIGRPWHLSFPDAEIKRLEKEIFEKKEWRGEAAGSKRDGSLFLREVSLSTIDDNSIVCIARDITDRNGFEEELERKARELSAANAEMEAFSYSLAHDMRNYITKIYTAAQLLQDMHKTTLEETGRYLVQMISKSSQDMEELIKDMLVLSCVTRSEIQRETVDLGEEARRLVAALVLTEPERAVELTCSPGLVAECDPHLLKIALDNLLGNAWKYTCQVLEARIEFGVGEYEGKRAFFVRDNGMGFDMKYADKLFEPFQRLPNTDGVPGTGIGLATVQRIILRHGGEVWGDGQPGKGATFYFTLPA